MPSVSLPTDAAGCAVSTLDADALFTRLGAAPVEASASKSSGDRGSGI
jgi:hypothetical protein